MSSRVPTARIAAGILLVACSTATSQTTGPVARTLPARPSTTSTPPEGLTVLIAGDSVPLHLVDTLGIVLSDTLGWDLVSATVPVCSIYGNPLAWPNGEPKGDPERCPGLVAPIQMSIGSAT